MARRFYASKVVAVGALTLALLAGCDPTPPKAFPHALTTPLPAALPAVALVGTDGKPFALTSLAGRWAWLYFGYARCPDVCPNAMNALVVEHQKLATPKDVAVVFVSIDPARDTPAKLKAFTAFFNPAFLAVTGQKPALDALAHAVGAGYSIEASPRGTAETRISHSNLVFVLDPAGRYVATYAPGVPAGALADDTAAAILAHRKEPPAP